MVGITAKCGQKIKDQNNMENSFYQSLYSNDTFTSAVGKLILSSAKLESMINVLLEVRGSKKTKKRPLGIMIQNLLEEINVDRTTEEHLKIILKEILSLTSFLIFSFIIRSLLFYIICRYSVGAYPVSRLYTKEKFPCDENPSFLATSVTLLPS